MLPERGPLPQDVLDFNLSFMTDSARYPHDFSERRKQRQLRFPADSGPVRFQITGWKRRRRDVVEETIGTPLFPIAS